MGKRKAVKKQRSPSPEDDPPKKNSKFTDDDDALFLKELLAVKASGAMVENGFKKTTYVEIARKLEKVQTTGAAKTWSSCKTRAKTV